LGKAALELASGSKREIEGIDKTDVDDYDIMQLRALAAFCQQPTGYGNTGPMSNYVLANSYY
jgi:hypothetical protein